MGKSRLIRNISRLWPLALGAFVLAGTACEALATQSARDAVETGREVRELEDTEIRPLEDQLRALIRTEIEPLQDELEDLFFQEREIEESVLRPLWESQEDPWSPGGELFVAQQSFEARFQDIEQRYRAIELEERKLQNSFNGGFDPYNSTESQALEDRRYELQRELDRLYRRGWDPVNEIYDQINYLSQGFNWSDPNTNDRVNEINNQINDLYSEANHVQQNVDGDASNFWKELDQINNELNNLYSWGRGPIDDLYRQIEDQQNYLNEFGSVASDADIATLEDNLSFLESQRDAILSSLKDGRISVETQVNAILAAYDADIDALETEISQLSSSDGSADSSTDSGISAELDALYAELQSENDAIDAIKADVDAEIDSLIATEENEVARISDRLDVLELELIEVDDGTASTTALVQEIETEITSLTGELSSLYSATDEASAVLEDDRDAAVAPHQDRVDEINAEIDDLLASLDTTGALTLSDDNSATIDSLEGEISDLKLQRDAETAPYYQELASIDQGIINETSFWQSQIDNIRGEIDSLRSQSSSSGSADDSFLRSLFSQIDQMEADYQAQVDKLERRRSELDAQVNNLYAVDPAQHIYEKIDELNGILFQLAEKSGSVAQDNQHRLDELQRQAYEMEQELKDKTRTLEDQLWDLDDELQDFYRSAELSQRGVNDHSSVAFNDLQDRRFALDDERFSIEKEMKEFFNSVDGGRNKVQQEAKRLENELLQPIRIRIREINNQLKDLRKEARGLERQIRSAEDFVDDRRRELENDIFSLLEGALAVGEALMEEDGLLADDSLPGEDGLFGDDGTGLDVPPFDGGSDLPEIQDDFTIDDPIIDIESDPVSVE